MCSGFGLFLRTVMAKPSLSILVIHINPQRMVSYHKFDPIHMSRSRLIHDSVGYVLPWHWRMQNYCTKISKQLCVWVSKVCLCHGMIMKRKPVYLINLDHLWTWKKLVVIPWIPQGMSRCHGQLGPQRSSACHGQCGPPWNPWAWSHHWRWATRGESAESHGSSANGHQCCGRLGRLGWITCNWWWYHTSFTVPGVIVWLHYVSRLLHDVAWIFTKTWRERERGVRVNLIAFAYV